MTGIPKYRLNHIRLILGLLTVTVFLVLLPNSKIAIFRFMENVVYKANNRTDGVVDDEIFRLYKSDRDIDDWQPVIANVCYVYSAYLNPESKENTSSIRILGTLRREEYTNNTFMPTLYCVIWIWRSDCQYPRVMTSPVTNVNLIGSIRGYCTVEFDCQFMMDMSELTNTSISTITEDDISSASVDNAAAATFTASHNIMKLHHHMISASFEATTNNISPERAYNVTEELHYNVPISVTATFTVCLWQPFFGVLFNPEWFVEWMEYNIIFGVEVVQMYSSEIPKIFYPYIRHYQSLGLLYVLPWTLPKEFHHLENNKFIDSRLQLTMIRDCHLRYRHRTKYIVGEDVDEIIVPRSPDHMSWSAMIQNSNCSADSTTYVARHLSFIYKSPSNETHGLVTLSSIRRVSTVLEFAQRTKYISKPSVKLFLIHAIDNRRTTCILDINIGALHHYRFLGHVVHDNHEERDLGIIIYRDRIIHRTAKTMDLVKQLIAFDENRKTFRTC